MLTNKDSKLALRESIASFLFETGGYHDPVNIAMTIEGNTSEVRSVLERMVRDGEVIEVDREYSYLSVKEDYHHPIVKHVNPALSPQEQSEYELLKNNINKSFYILGASLARIRNLRLYRGEYSTFEEFCKAEFGYTRRYVDFQILGAEITEDLKFAARQKNILRTISSQNYIDIDILTTSETQVRPLSKFNKEKRVELWQKACDRAGGVPTARVVKEVVSEEKQKQSSDIALPKKRLELQSYVRVISQAKELKNIRGCWGQIVSIEELGYTILTWRGVRSEVKDSDLQAMSDVDIKQAQQLLNRLNLLRTKILGLDKANVDFDGERGFRLGSISNRRVGFIDVDPKNAPQFDPDAWNFLETIGKRDRPSLSPVLEKLLSCLEDFF